MSRQAQQSFAKSQLPLATDTERLVAVIMAPQGNLLRKLAAAERIYTLIPTYTWRMLTTSAINLLGRDALLDNGGSEYEAKRQLYANTLISMLRFMDKTREKIVEVKLPPIVIPEELKKSTVSNARDMVATTLTNWFYSATEESRKRGKPFSYDVEKPGYVLLIGFASLVIVNGLRQLAIVGE